MCGCYGKSADVVALDNDEHGYAAIFVREDSVIVMAETPQVDSSRVALSMEEFRRFCEDGLRAIAG